MKHVWNNGRLLKSGTCNYQTTALYSETTNPDFF